MFNKCLMIRVCLLKPPCEFENIQAVLTSLDCLDLDCFSLQYDEFSHVNFDQYDVLIFCVNRIYFKDVENTLLTLELMFEGVVLVVDDAFNIQNKLIVQQLKCDVYFHLPVNFKVFVEYFDSFLAQFKGNVLKYKDLILDLNDRTLNRAGNILKLQNMEFRLLQYLLKNKGKVIPKEQILEDVWDMNSLISSKTVEVHMCRLRRKVDFAFENKLLHTVPNTGYMLK